MSDLPHRTSSSRNLFITDTHAIHQWDDGEAKQDITRTADPAAVLDFMQHIAELYESDVSQSTPSPTEISAADDFPREGVDPREALPLYAKIKNDGFVYIRDPQGGEYVMWSVNEWIAPRPGVNVSDWNQSDIPALEDDRTGINETVIGTVLNAIRLAYENPTELKQRFGRVQLETA